MNNINHNRTLNRTLNRNLNQNLINSQISDFHFYRQIYIFINSLLFGVIIISMSNENGNGNGNENGNENAIEKNKQILYIAGMFVFICELEYMGLL